MSAVVVARPHPPTVEEHRDWTWGGATLIAVACLAVAIVAEAVAAGPLRNWYPVLLKPGWSPPGWLFGPAGVAAYLAMAAAGAVVWVVRDRDDVCCPLAAFAVQLAAGLAWVVLFFGLGHTLLGFVDGLVMWVTLGLAAVQFFGVSRLAGWLLVPCWAWATYILAMNSAIVFMWV
jgi:benzodiazapine receptor